MDCGVETVGGIGFQSVAFAITRWKPTYMGDSICSSASIDSRDSLIRAMKGSMSWPFSRRVGTSMAGPTTEIDLRWP